MILHSKILFIMYSIQANCSIAFLDCRGYYDFAAQIVGLMLAGMVFYLAMVNYRQLKRQKDKFNDSEYENSLRRKIRVNLLNVIFLLVFVLHIVFSMVLFGMINDQSATSITTKQLEKWYKFSELLFVQLLNVLLLTVGWLYWKGLYFFYNVKQIQAPLPFKDGFKYIIYICIFYCISALVTGIILIFQQADNHQFIQNLLVLASTGVSLLLFLFCRMSYYTNIFRSIRLGKKVIRRQRIYNVLIIFSALARIILSTLGMNDINFDQVRNFNSNCQDLSPYHAIILLSITVGVDLLPSYVFSRIFTTFERQRHLHAYDIEQTLFSIQPSQLASGCSRQ